MYKNKLILTIVIAAVMLNFSTCGEEPVSETGGEEPYKSSLSVSGRQVWTQNPEAVRISRVYNQYDGTHNINVITPVVNPEFDPDAGVSGDNPPYIRKSVGEGKIENGFLSFSVNDNIEDSLLGWQLFELIFREWLRNEDGEDGNLTSSHEVNGNMILLEAINPDNSALIDGMLDRQRYIGTSTTITKETILYVYVDGDCELSANASSGFQPGNYFYYSEAINLKLKKGWNLISRGETYGTNFSGSAIISMEVRSISKPENSRWVMYPGFSY
ncbi:MAG: hypothetical protein FWC03_13205 [Treponema sp.]|nr:hypothetical protein [Treponema sp.]